jgi:hypothetical protein
MDHMNHIHTVVHPCEHCHGEHFHDVTYAGRLLAPTLRSNCGHEIAKSLPGLRRAYIADIEHRVLTKPFRMLRHAVHHPVTLAPAVLAKPAKMEMELRVLQGRQCRRVGT